MSSINNKDDLDAIVRSGASDEEKLRELTRRSFLVKSTALATAAAGLSGGLARSAFAATRAASAAAAPTLTLASSGAWQGFDALNLAYIANGPSMELLSACAGTLVQVFLPPSLPAAQRAAAPADNSHSRNLRLNQLQRLSRNPRRSRSQALPSLPRRRLSRRQSRPLL
jgi:hypothetical protein